ncbi:hypothetical protein QBC45DRAFT_465384 [Copromyces sp. CBS 386.78]|nr:hypothetical protein QBC45DRAFT_465384 [Copromyces sp. CBS 386.78]
MVHLTSALLLASAASFAVAVAAPASQLFERQCSVAGSYPTASVSATRRSIIGMGGSSIPIPSNVASITFPNDDFVQLSGGSSRGKGKFYTLFGSSHSAGALTAWTGSSTRSNKNKCSLLRDGIDPKRLGVTGCSRNGIEGRLMPQESGAGKNDIDWLGPVVSTTGCMQAGRLMYKAYGVPNLMGFSLVGGHSHCQFPSSQLSELTSYINYFLLNSGTAPAAVERSSAKVDLKSWAPWDVPTLS